MCTIIVTIRSVLWAVMTIAGSLMILVSLFTNRFVLFFCDYFPLFIFFTINRWLIGGFQVPTNANSLTNSFNSAMDKFGDFASGQPLDDKVAVGIFLDCVKPEGSLVSLFLLYCVAGFKVAQTKLKIAPTSYSPGALKFMDLLPEVNQNRFP